MKFRSVSSNKDFDVDEVVQELYKFVESTTDYEHKLIVGSDSQRFGRKTVYVTVIVVHKVGKGGRMFYCKNILPHRNFIDLSSRITQETAYTVEVLQAIEKSILVDLVGRDNLSAHVDAGHSGDSRKIVDSCVGWINGLGFECHHKPDAFVASHVADKFTK